MVALMATLGALAALLPPIVTGELLAEIIPRVDVPMWTAATQVRLMVLLDLTHPKTVTVSQIAAAAAKWSAPGLSRRFTTCGTASTKERFVCYSLQWMRYLGWLEEPFVPPPHPYTDQVAEFLDWARADRGYAEGSLENFLTAANDFLSFVAEFGSGDSLASITPSDIDRYFVRKASLQSFARPTIASRAHSLRTFFTFAERRDYCRRGIAAAIKSPRLFDGEGTLPRLCRADALRVLATTESDRPADIRDRAVLKLLIGYGLRGIEVRSLRLDDIDWRNDKLHIRRGKSGKHDVLPLVAGSGNALVRYIREVRPVRPERTVFFTVKAPIQPLSRNALGRIVRHRIRRLGIASAKSGPHALRHAAAQALLDDGRSMVEIADFLGHTSPSSTRTYARFDLKSLREVADFDLGDLT